MGTSQPYGAPTTPQWKKLKDKVTQVARAGGVSDVDAQTVVARFVTALGQMRAHTAPNAAGAGPQGPGPAAPVSNELIPTLLRFLQFVDQVQQHGFSMAVAPYLHDIQNPQRKDLILGLLNGLGPDGCTLIDVDIRYALLQILNMGHPTDTAATYASAFTVETGARLDQVIRAYFGAYIEHALQRFLYERLTERVGHDAALGSVAAATRSLWQQVNALPTPRMPAGGWDSADGQQVLTTYLSMLAQQVGLRG